MTCAWKELIGILPSWLRRDADIYREDLQEVRMRLGQAVQLLTRKGIVSIPKMVSGEDLSYTVNAASRYSPWTSTGAAFGYITAPGGHRIGLCGEAVVQNGKMTGIRSVSAINVRVARDFPGMARQIGSLSGSILILGSPGCGKTTLLRDLIRQISCFETVSVVDERGELFPDGFDRGRALDVLQYCPKAQGLDAVIRTMSPQTVAIDEITAQADCDALYNAAWCGVRLIATAHAASRHELLTRPVYKPILEKSLFSWLIILDKQKQYRVERMGL